ncbi:adenosine 3'-phospho 5'-phosphosulfate transporter 1 isoform X1 [Schistocerca gregaria]|uniref:adenosine 3'-phospho 5'-phosphosulfate transporter 1 isoform X1 n=3 Tax=Schistocerca gregaria TaxID=7010 RepID=UPI00211EF51A|nr:adenosine 3'-phospho 5'-phosphosulfate transporter 1 isoform X1 [Schistocerca gregaria]
MYRPLELTIGLCFAATIAVSYLASQFLKSLIVMDQQRLEPSGLYLTLSDNWVTRLMLNILGYATVFVPGFFIFMYVKRSKHLELEGHSCVTRLVKVCFLGPEPLLGVDNKQSGQSASHAPQPPRTILQETLLIVFCFMGLQTTYLTWGILQEKVMTQEYEASDGTKGHFTDSQFLVFVNRILAFLLSGTYILTTNQTRHAAPMYKYVYCSFSNIMSSWCQYEALKYVSFPTQVLAKASKIIPVMIMGKIVSRAKYEYYEYVTAFLISLGMTFFLLGSSDDKGTTVTTFSGIILLASYMIFDSFTSNWQGSLFAQYNMSSVQMMCGVNLFSCIFTGVSLFQQGGFIRSVNFMAQFPKFIFDCLILSVCSAAGQLFIFFTISTFGPVIFAIIMTIRQGLAILLSCIIYQHHITALGIIGVFVVFISIFLRVYCNQRLRSIRKKTQVAAGIKV